MKSLIPRRKRRKKQMLREISDNLKKLRLWQPQTQEKRIKSNGNLNRSCFSLKRRSVNRRNYSTPSRYKMTTKKVRAITKWTKKASS